MPNFQVTGPKFQACKHIQINSSSSWLLTTDYVLPNVALSYEQSYKPYQCTLRMTFIIILSLLTHYIHCTLKQGVAHVRGIENGVHNMLPVA